MGSATRGDARGETRREEQFVRLAYLYIDEIKITYDPVSLDKKHVKQIRESIEQIGQIHPPIINRDQVLLLGRHRMAALVDSYLESAWFLVVDEGTIDLEVASIDEDLFRRHISVLERSEMFLLREEILLDSGSRAQSGQGSRLIDDVQPSLVTTSDIAEEMGMSKRSYLRYLRIAREICQEARDLVRPTGTAHVLRQLMDLAGLPSGDQVAVARVLANREAETVSASLAMVRRAKGRRRKGRFEKTREEYRIVRADPVDGAEVLDPGSIALIATYVPDAAIGAPMWDTEAETRYTDQVIDAHRRLAKMARQVLADGGNLVVMTASTTLDRVLAAMRTHIDFIDSTPFVVKQNPDRPWRSLLVFANGKRDETPNTLRLIESRPLDCVCFDPVLEALSVRGATVFDPYGHAEIAGSALYTERKYVGFQPTRDLVCWLALKLDECLESLHGHLG